MLLKVWVILPVVVLYTLKFQRSYSLLAHPFRPTSSWSARVTTADIAGIEDRQRPIRERTNRVVFYNTMNMLLCMDGHLKDGSDDEISNFVVSMDDDDESEVDDDNDNIDDYRMTMMTDHPTTTNYDLPTLNSLPLVLNENSITNSDDTHPQQQQQQQQHYHCYCLRSCDPKHPNTTYVGYTTNPHRRIRQHNGILKNGGAWKTKLRGRPWEFIVIVYGFATSKHALQFEWAWQHCDRSLAVRAALGDTVAKTLKRKRGTNGQLFILKTLLFQCPELFNTTTTTTITNSSKDNHCEIAINQQDHENMPLSSLSSSSSSPFGGRTTTNHLTLYFLNDKYRSMYEKIRLLDIPPVATQTSSPHDDPSTHAVGSNHHHHHHHHHHLLPSVSVQSITSMEDMPFYPTRNIAMRSRKHSTNAITRVENNANDKENNTAVLSFKAQPLTKGLIKTVKKRTEVQKKRTNTTVRTSSSAPSSMVSPHAPPRKRQQKNPSIRKINRNKTKTTTDVSTTMSEVADVEIPPQPKSQNSSAKSMDATYQRYLQSSQLLMEGDSSDQDDNDIVEMRTSATTGAIAKLTSSMRDMSVSPSPLSSSSSSSSSSPSSSLKEYDVVDDGARSLSVDESSVSSEWDFDLMPMIENGNKGTESDNSNHNIPTCNDTSSFANGTLSQVSLVKQSEGKHSIVANAAAVRRLSSSDESDRSKVAAPMKAVLAKRPSRTLNDIHPMPRTDDNFIIRNDSLVASSDVDDDNNDAGMTPRPIGSADDAATGRQIVIALDGEETYDAVHDSSNIRNDVLLAMIRPTTSRTKTTKPLKRRGPNKQQQRNDDTSNAADDLLLIDLCSP
jgi:predicted GIY-YIG superfamily endonuclease